MTIQPLLHLSPIAHNSHPSFNPMLTRIIFFITISFILHGAFAATNAGGTLSLTLTDPSRNRQVPVELYFPTNAGTCTSERQCPVAILSAGYGISHLDYTFLASQLNRLGYLVVSINHQLPSDPKLDRTGDIRLQLKVMWQQGASNIGFAQDELKSSYPQFAWRRVVLVGHSVGGDSSAFFATEFGPSVSALITLDNRRVKLPRNRSTRVLSIRAGDTEADPEVLPSVAERAEYDSCVVKIGGSRHNDMQDAGNVQLKEKINHAIELFLSEDSDGRTQSRCDVGSSLR